MRELPWPAGSTILVLAPHADDETLGCGGLLHRAHEAGLRTQVLVMAVDGDEAERAQREKELALACGHLGVDEAEVLFRMDRLPYADDRWIDLLESHVQRIQPTVLCLPFFGAYHQEHRATAAVAMSVTRPLASTARYRPPTVLAFEELSDCWSAFPAPQPRWYVELDEVDLDAKCAALAAHGSQFDEEFGSRSVRSIRALAALRGAQVGVPFAEAYEPLLQLV